MSKNQQLNKSFAFTTEKPDTKIAVLNYKLLCMLDNYFLLEVKPETGRHHQIRVQLAAIGCPIKGDVKYGADRTNNNGSIHLHARSIAFIHPVKQEPLSIIASPPTDPVWNACLEQLEMR
jgi:23S rRNA pseudouridine1911/1915/1917 synthase